MIETFIKQPKAVQAIAFNCTPEEVLYIKKFGGASIGPITKAVNTFSVPSLSIETTEGKRQIMTEGDYLVKDGKNLYIRSKKVFEENYIKGSIQDVSDGYHTFKELYNHRCILFSIVCNLHKDLAWKSKLHSDDTMFSEYFIVGITTPEGDFSYHYHIQEWEKFDVKELPKAPVWDGHLSSDITRLYSLLGNKYA